MRTVAFVRTTNIYDDSRATKEITALAEAGYHVVVLGWDRNGEAEEKSKEAFKNLNVECRFFSCQLPSGIGIRNIDKLIKWLSWTKKQLKTIEQLEAVHACNLDGGFGAYQFCRKNEIILVYDIYDYYIDSHAIPELVKSFVEKQEIKIINFSKTTIICTEERREQIKKAKPQHILVLHNSPDVPEVEKKETSYDYAYCGSLCDLRLIKEILDVYKEHLNLHFAFAGNDKYKSDVEQLAKAYSNLDYYGTVPYSQVLEIESQAKVLSAIYEPSIRNHKLCAPNKFYEALALGKPIIVCRGTGIDKIVEENKLGKVINYNAKEFYQALLDLLSSPSDIIEMGERARLLYEQKYRWSLMKQNLIKQYTDMIDYR